MKVSALGAAAGGVVLSGIVIAVPFAWPRAQGCTAASSDGTKWVPVQPILFRDDRNSRNLAVKFAKSRPA